MRTRIPWTAALTIVWLGSGCGPSDPDGSPGEPAPDAAHDSGVPSGLFDGETDAGARVCDPATLMGLTVLARGGWDPLGYPPYALDDCTLVYVASAGSAGELRKRDLSTGREEVLSAASDTPSRPSASGETIAWEVLVGGKSQVRVWHRGITRTLSGAFDHAGEPRVTAGAVAFTAWLGAAVNDDTDVYVYDADRQSLSALATGPGQQRFSDISSTHVAVTDFSEDPKGHFDEGQSLSDIVVFERSTAKRIERKLLGKQAFPMLGTGGRFAYLEWNSIHPEPKLAAFFLKHGGIEGAPAADVNVKGSDVVRTDVAYVRPSVRGMGIDFIDTSSGSAQLYRARLDGPLGATVVAGATGRLLGPIAAERMTLVGIRLGTTPGALGPTLRLFGVAR